MNNEQLTKRLLLKGSMGMAFIAGISPLVHAKDSMSKPNNNTRYGNTSETCAKSHISNWEDSYEKILARIKEPKFRDKTYNIEDYGAKMDQDISEILSKLIEQCSLSGGGKIVIPASTYYCGPIHLKSNVHLHFLDGAIIRFLTEPKKYPNVMTRWEGVECLNYSPLIYAYKQKNIAITGNAILDGQASFDNWWAWNNKKATVLQKEGRNRLFEMGENNTPVEQRIFGEGYFLRPNFIQPYECENVLISDVKIINSPMWELNPVLSKNVIVRNVNVESHGPNNDGCDPESCQDVLIENCVFNTGDDCIAIKSGRNNDGRRVNVPSDGIIIRNCKMVDGHGGVVLGSECSGHIRNIFVQDCKMDSPHLSRAVRFKNNAVRGGVLEKVSVKNLKVGKVSESFLTIDLLYEEGEHGAYTPVVRDISISDCIVENAPRVNFILSFENAIVDQITYKNCHFKNLVKPDVINTSGEVKFINTKLVPKVEEKSKDQAGKL